MERVGGTLYVCCVGVVGDRSRQKSPNLNPLNRCYGQNAREVGTRDWSVEVLYLDHNPLRPVPIPLRQVYYSDVIERKGEVRTWKTTGSTGLPKLSSSSGRTKAFDAYDKPWVSTLCINSPALPSLQSKVWTYGPAIRERESRRQESEWSQKTGETQQP